MNTVIKLEIDLNQIFSSTAYVNEYGEEVDFEPANPEENIARAVINSLTKILEKDISGKVDKMIDDKVAEKVDLEVTKATEGLTEKILNRSVKITDGYGRDKFEGTVEDRIIKGFDDFLNEKVDKYGNYSTYPSDSTRLEYIITDRIKKLQSELTEATVKSVNESMNVYVGKVEQEVKNKIEAALKSKLTDTIFKNLNIDELINDVKKIGAKSE